ncbi:hypothetical protein [Pedobacter africanus]|uniref:Uncharacterized protein n=1 Tax=Pedobacter africanus TaxID=151894 RepID=A0A1W1YLH0_9SPHI|nr:hypothetical protein [Pedobacter africanus]SMC36989.1 hypothetical protein SAMN04488524_0010 [Pedobacter africanus]
MEKYKKELDRIRVIFENFYTVKVTSSDKEYETNKINKQQIQQLIVRIKQTQDLSQTDQQDLVNEALILLAKNTGSAEDIEIAEQILDHLFFELKIISQHEVDRFYQCNATRRWE